MSVINTFTKPNLRTIRVDLDAAIALVAKKYGITLSVGTMSFTPNTFTAKITAVTDSATGGVVGGNVKWRAAFLKNAVVMGFAKTDLGKKFNYYGDEVTIVGARPNARQPIVLMRKDGTFIAAGTQFVINALRANTSGVAA